MSLLKEERVSAPDSPTITSQDTGLPTASLQAHAPFEMDAQVPAGWPSYLRLAANWNATKRDRCPIPSCTIEFDHDNLWPHPQADHGLTESSRCPFPGCGVILVSLRTHVRRIHWRLPSQVEGCPACGAAYHRRYDEYHVVRCTSPERQWDLMGSQESE